MNIQRIVETEEWTCEANSHLTNWELGKENYLLGNDVPRYPAPAIPLAVRYELVPGLSGVYVRKPLSDGFTTVAVWFTD